MVTLELHTTFCNILVMICGVLSFTLDVLLDILDIMELIPLHSILYIMNMKSYLPGCPETDLVEIMQL